jgi:hypothetical protein
LRKTEIQLKEYAAIVEKERLPESQRNLSDQERQAIQDSTPKQEISDEQLQQYLGKVNYRMQHSNALADIEPLIGTKGLKESLKKYQDNVFSTKDQKKLDTESPNDITTYTGDLNELNTTANLMLGLGHELHELGQKKDRMVMELNGKVREHEDVDIDLMHSGTMRFDDGDMTGLFFTELKSSFNSLFEKYLVKGEATQLDLNQAGQMQKIISAARDNAAQLMIAINTKSATQTDASGITSIKTDKDGANTPKNIAIAYRMIESFEKAYSDIFKEPVNIRVIDENGTDIKAAMRRIAALHEEIPITPQNN